MYIANDETGNRISIEAADPLKTYFCPICNEPLIIKAKDSTCVHTHFAHKRGAVCYDNWTHDMSEWHKKWQNCFPVEFREVVMEKDGIKHRADVFNGSVVIEFQHSPITADEIRARNDFYLSCGYPVVWVFDMTDRIKNDHGDSIDPMKCRADDLCIKRKSNQFENVLRQGVNIFFQYKTTTSSSKSNDNLVDVLILLTKLDSKYFSFAPLCEYVFELSFIKEFREIDINFPSITDIINETNKRNQEINRQRQEQLKRQLDYYLNQIRNRYKRRNPRL